MKDRVKCGICGGEYINLAPHLPTHKITVKAYLAKYGGEIVSEGFKRQSAERIANGLIPKISKVQLVFFEQVLNIFRDEHSELQYLEKYYTIDIAFPKRKVAVEVDGDYWHNREGLPIDQLGKAQIRNIANDKAKETFLKRRGWEIVRFWEGDIQEDLTRCLESLKNILKSKVSIPKFNYNDFYRDRIKQCVVCGGDLSTKQIINKAHCCSRKCSDEKRKKQHEVVRSCKECGIEFKTTRTGNKSFCDCFCQKKYEKKHIKERSAKAAISIVNSDYNKKRRS